MSVDYLFTFHQVEESLLRVGSAGLSPEAIRLSLESYRHFEDLRLSDDECFRRMVSVIFYSGFWAATVNEKLDLILRYLGDYRTVARYGRADVDAILSDRKMIRHCGKVKACVHNAGAFETMVNEYGSFDDYIRSFAPKKSAAISSAVTGGESDRHATHFRCTRMSIASFSQQL